jgi:hypothetical protein
MCRGENRTSFDTIEAEGPSEVIALALRASQCGDHPERMGCARLFDVKNKR